MSQRNVKHVTKILSQQRQEEELSSVLIDAELIIGDRIESLRFGNSCQCFYCGDWINIEIDHCIPVSFLRAMIRKGMLHGIGITTWSCSECNRILSDNMFWEFEFRFRFVRESLRTKLIKKYKCAVWTKKEINKLDYTLQTYVRHHQLRNEIAASRLDWEHNLQFKRMCIDLKHKVRDAKTEFTKTFFQGFLLSVK